MLPSISINNTSAAYTESINENNNDEVNRLGKVRISGEILLG